MEQTNCRVFSPKKIVSWYSRTSFGILISILAPHNPIISFTILSQPLIAPTSTSRLNVSSATYVHTAVTTDAEVSTLGGLAASAERSHTTARLPGPANTPRHSCDEVLADVGGWFPRKGCQRDRCDGGIHPQAKHSAVDGQDHNERKHRDQQPADQCDGPQRDRSQKPTLLMASTSSCGSVVLFMPDVPDCVITVDTVPCTMENTACMSSSP